MLTDNKIKHIIQVAYETRHYMDGILTKDDPDREAKLDAAFITGLLHDIGYDKLDEDDDISTHPAISAEMARNFLKYADDAVKAITDHGHDDCSSPFGYALNKADLTVDSHGNPVDMEQRVLRIEGRYPGTTHAVNARRQYECVLDAERHMKDAGASPRSYKAVDFDRFSDNCPWSYTYQKESINNGYNCSHPSQEMTEEIEGETVPIGRCHCFSCPLGTAAEQQDLEPDPNDTDAIHGDIDWSGVTGDNERKPSPDEIGEDDVLLVPSDTGMDSDQAEALFWYELYMNRYDNSWKDRNYEQKTFYENRKITKRMPKDMEDG